MNSKKKILTVSFFASFTILIVTLIIKSYPYLTPTLPQIKTNKTVSTVPEELTKHTVKVVRVIDGDTIKLENGEIVRYIGIDAPETVDPKKSIECFGQEASQKNKELVEGKMVQLEKDVSETDKYGRLLRYVWVGDIMVNEYLIKNGYSHISTFSPDIKYHEIFLQSEKLAIKQSKGLWGNVCKTPTPKQIF